MSNLFVNQEELNTLRSLIAPLDTEQVRQAYRERRFSRADSVKDLDMRYRWDLLWASRFSPSEIYARGGIDSHIDTALRRIVAPLEETADNAS